MPLGSTELVMRSHGKPAGKRGLSRQAVFEGIDEVLSIPGVSVHIYGKKETKPYRKMGHITVVDKNIENALEKAEIVKKTIRVVSEG